MPVRNHLSRLTASVLGRDRDQGRDRDRDRPVRAMGGGKAGLGVADGRCVLTEM